MTAANEYRGLSQLQPPLRDAPWERKLSMRRLREVAGMEPHEFRECDETRMVPDFFAVMDGEFWVLEIEGTHPVNRDRILAWARLADFVGHLVTVRLFVHVTRLNVTTEPSLPDALMEWYASRVPAAR